jgi:hypothetical protein
MERRIEEEALPPNPETEPLEGNFPPEEWVEPIEIGMCTRPSTPTRPSSPAPCPDKSGILVSEAKAARLTLTKFRYAELRKLFESDIVVWKAHRELYEERLKLADRAIQDLQPSWWDRHKGELGLVGGFLLGAAATLVIVSAVQ